MTIPEIISTLRERFGDAIGASVEFRGQTGVGVTREKIVEVSRFLKIEAGFDVLVDLCGLDNYGTEPRFGMDYLLYSMRDKHHLRLKVGIPEADAVVDTVSTVWKAANWQEREAWDMYGIKFRGHPNLKRILMWEGYPHHPQRKDFPLAGLPADLPEYGKEVGQTATANMLGGPFVTAPGTTQTIDREPRQFDTAAERTDYLSTPTKKEQV
jgi:NADH-quinone oxidoreductase subunit C